MLYDRQLRRTTSAGQTAMVTAPIPVHQSGQHLGRPDPSGMKRGQPRVDLVLAQYVLLRSSQSSTRTTTSEQARAAAVTFDEARTVVLD